MEDIPFTYCINDYRINKDLKSGTLTGYKRNEVLKAMSNAIINSKIEDACRWSVELHISGYVDYIFDELFTTYINYININNPYYLFYFIRRKKYYYELISEVPKKIIIFTRNNQEIRNLICELVSILVYSKKIIYFKIKDYQKYQYMLININILNKKLYQVIHIIL